MVAWLSLFRDVSFVLAACRVLPGRAFANETHEQPIGASKLLQKKTQMAAVGKFGMSRSK